jgi:hypothetical protein
MFSSSLFLFMCSATYLAKAAAPSVQLERHGRNPLLHLVSIAEICSGVKTNFRRFVKVSFKGRVNHSVTLLFKDSIGLERNCLIMADSFSEA